MTPVTAPAPANPQSTTFLKGEPKALGTVQIVIGTMTFLFGIVLSSFDLSPAIISGITLWGSLIFISSGALSVAAANNSTSCVVKASLGMNVFSAVTAAIAMILFAVDMVYSSVFIPWCRRHYYGDYNSYNRCDFSSLQLWNGIYGVLLVFSLLEFIISICSSAFACKVTCCSGSPPMYSHPLNAYPTHAQPTHTYPMNAQPTHTYPMHAQPMNVQPTHAYPMNAQPTHTYPVHAQPLNAQLTDAPPMYNPAFCTPQDPQQSVVKAHNKL